MSNSEIRRNLGFGLPHGEYKLADVKSSVRHIKLQKFEEEPSAIPEFLLPKWGESWDSFEWSPPITANAQIKTWMVVRPTITMPSIAMGELNRMQQEIHNKFCAGLLAGMITYYDGTVNPVEWHEMYVQPEEEKPVDVMAITRQMCK